MVTNNKTDKIVDKIRKLLALSKGSSGAEAATAAAFARRLMQEHAVATEALSEAQLLDEDPMAEAFLVIDRSAWKAKLAWALASHVNVRALRYKGSYRHPVSGEWGEKRMPYLRGFGHESDLAIWLYLYTVAAREIGRLAEDYKRKEKALSGYITRSEMTAWRESAVSGLSNKLCQMRAEEKTTPKGQSTALVLQSRADRALAHQKDTCTASKTGWKTTSKGHNRLGFHAGQSIDLRPAISKGPARKKLTG